MELKVAEKNKVILPQGFHASGMHCGIKRKKFDIGLLYSDIPCNAAAVYTTNRIKAAPIVVNREHLKNGTAQALVLCSGVANTGTGEKGIRDAQEIACIAASELKIDCNDVLVSSTGIIGIPLPMPKIRKAIPEICSNKNSEGGIDFATAARTTDTFAKHYTLRFNVGGNIATITGIAKGSGMVHPNMATMLSFITTNLSITTEMLGKALKVSVDETYNMISVDGETSTNDMAIIMANGLAANKVIDSDGEEFDSFVNVLNMLNRELSKQIVKDGEGATKLLEVVVEGAANIEDARMAAIAIAKSNLVKTAIFGEDANWGRILCVVGYSGADVVEDKLDIYLKSSRGRIQVVENGIDNMVDYRIACSVLGDKEVSIIVNLNNGDHMATAWGCDLSFEYVRINGSMRS